MAKIKALSISTPQGAAGTLRKDSRFVFNYEDGLDRARQISIGMPVRAESYSSTLLHPIFAMNRPEGYLFDVIVKRMAKFEDLDDMRLLSILGGNQIGRLSYAETPTARVARPVRIGREEILRSTQPGIFEFLVDTYFDSGISGVQPKVMVADADRIPPAKGSAVVNDLIVKSSGVDYPFLAQNEFLCMEAARLAGIEVAPFWLSDDGKLFVMQRFDLHGDQRLGFEDMSVLMNKAPDPAGHYKYQESYEAIARVINAYCRGNEAVASLRRFFEYFVISVLVRNGDAHLKNFALLYADPDLAQCSPRLSPLYDVVTTTAYNYPDPRTGGTRIDETLALKFNKAKTYPSQADLLRFGQQTCHVNDPAAVIERISDAMSAALTMHANRIDPSVLQKLREQWDIGRGQLGRVLAPLQSVVIDGIEPEKGPGL